MFTPACSKKTIFRKTPPSVVSGYGKRSINLNNEIWYRHPNSEAGNDEIQNVNMDFYFVGITF
jgi:hypothetical protein